MSGNLEEPPQESSEAERSGARPPSMKAVASDAARIYQSAGDQVVAETGDVHLHYVDGVREARRARADAAAECPYPGLEPFETGDARWFFGRDALIAQVLAELDRPGTADGPLVIVAPSGAGKSSLLRAGVLPALAEGRLPGSADWTPLLLTPTERPVEELTARLARAVAAAPEDVRRAVEAGPQALTALLRTSPRALRLVLVVDQLEELFTLCTDEPERHAFLDVLEALSTGPVPAAHVVCALRSDFYSRCLAHPQLRSALQYRQTVVGPLTEEGLREAILYPAREAGLTLEPGLVELMLADLGEPGREAGRLPLLAHALRATWQQRQGSTLTVGGYRTTGGIGQAVTTSAERIYDGLGPAARAAARAMLLRLVRIGESADGADDTRRRLRLSDLPPDIVGVFTAGRLLTVEHDSVTIAHEALIRAWPRLRMWIESDRADRLVRQSLEEAASAWDRQDRDPGMLYRGERLAAAHGVADQASPLATVFLTASTQRARRAASRRNRVIAVLTALTIVAVAAAVTAVRQSLTARAERDTAVFHQLLAKADHLRGTDPSLAAQLDLAAHRMSAGDPEAYTRLVNDAASTLSTTLAHRDPVGEVMFSPDGRFLAGVGMDGALELWETTDLQRPVSRTGLLRGLDPGVLTTAFSPDGKRIAVGGEKLVQLWNLADPARPKAEAALPTDHGVNTIAFSPDGSRLAVGHGAEVRLWDLAVPTSPAPLGEPLAHTDSVVQLRFGRDGTVLVTGRSGGETADDVVRVWDLTNPATSTPRSVVLKTEGRRSSGWFGMSPDGKEIAVAAHGGTVHRWDIGDPTAPKPLGEPLPGHGRTWPLSLAYGPDGHSLAVAGDDVTIRLWDITDRARPKPRGTPLPGTAPVSDGLPSNLWGHGHQLTFSPNGSTLAAAAEDGTVRLWNVALPEHITPLGNVLTGHTGAVSSLQFSPDGSILATAGNDSTVRLWTLPGSRLLQRTEPVGVSISPDGDILAVHGDGTDRGVRLWRISPAGTVTPIDAGPHFKDAHSAVFSPVGRTLAVATGGTEDAVVELWDLSDPASPRAVGQPMSGHRLFVRRMVFSPDGRAIFTDDGVTVRLWNLGDPARLPAPAKLTDLAAAAAENYGVSTSGLSLSADGATLAVAVSEGRQHDVHLWDVRDPARPRSASNVSEPLGSPAAGPPETLSSLVIAGKTLLIGDEKGRLHRWDIDDPKQPRPLGPALGAHTAKISSIALGPDGTSLATSGDDHIVRLWDIRDRDRIQPLGTPLTGHSGPVMDVSYSRDGRRLVSVARDGVLQLRFLHSQELARTVCTATGRALTRDEWKRHLPGLPYKPPC
ncbi:AAA family ATPase [Streptomyces sp. NPDC001389]|uniref:nSTAND1 domain-containing NTPase n=1 Tax=Streptomyces sp. NPDC001389 TaxID=3364569 RepID=UPI0036BD6EA6